MVELFLIVVIIILGVLGSTHLKAREMALSAVLSHCRKLELQLLDDYVALEGYRLKRNSENRLQLWRCYVFEFSATGWERYHGKIAVIGGRVESIYLDPYRMS